MKATIKTTGEVIDVEWSNARLRWIQIIPNRRNKPLQNCDIEIYQDEPTDFSNIFDWESFRNETAAKAMQSLISNPNIARPQSFDDNEANIAFLNVAIRYTDELIKQLKAKQYGKIY